MPLFDLAIEALVALLLVITLAYCFVLERKLAALRTGQDGLKEVITSLDKATDRAQESLAALKTEGMNAGGALREQSQQALDLVDELKLMCQAGDRVANRLADQRSNRGDVTVEMPVQGQEIQLPGDGPSGDGLLDALQQAR